MKQSLTSARRPLEILIHIISWGIVFGFPFFFIDRTGDSINWHAYLRHSAVPLSFVTVFYLNYFLLVPHLLFREQKNKYIIYNILLVCLIGLLLHIWQSLNAPAPTLKKPHMPPGWIFFVRDILSLIFTIGLSAAIRMSARWGQAEAARREAEKSRTEAELKNLRNQLNPHFLLNTLNNIYSLIAFSPEKAQEAVHDLSRLLRYVLYDSSQPMVPLEKELDFIRNYVELMRIRLPEHVKLTTDISSATSETQVAPLLFISLIENAFKHGVCHNKPSFIDLKIHQEGTRIVCSIRNSDFPKDNGQDKSGSGIGLQNLSRRLELLYPLHHIFTYGQKGDEYVCLLELQA